MFMMPCSLKFPDETSSPTTILHSSIHYVPGQSHTRLNDISYALLVAVSPCDIRCRSATLAAATVKDNLVVELGLVETMLLLELLLAENNGLRKARQWDGHSRGNGTLRYFIWLTDIDEIHILTQRKRAGHNCIQLMMRTSLGCSVSCLTRS